MSAAFAGAVPSALSQAFQSYQTRPKIGCGDEETTQIRGTLNVEVSELLSVLPVFGDQLYDEQSTLSWVESSFRPW